MTRLTTCALLSCVAVAGAQPRFPVLRPGESWPPPAKAMEVAPVMPVQWPLLAQPTVRDDLGLNAAQTRSLERVLALQSVSNAAFYWGTRGSFTPDMVKSFKESVRDEFWTQSLTKAQRTRLRQIEYQLREREFGAHETLAMAARDLGLRADQLEDVTSIKSQRVEEIAKLVTSGERFDKVKTKVASTNGDTYDKIAEMLTRTQRERLKELRGKAFAGKIDMNAPPAGPKPTMYPGEFFGIYEFEVRYFASVTVREELQVTNAQLAALRDAVTEWNGKYDGLDGKPVERAAALHEKTDKMLDMLLSKVQRARFDQLMAQRRAIIGGREAACGYPAVVAALKISPNQLRQLKDGTSVKDALTEAQAFALERFFGGALDFGIVAADDPIMKKASELRALARQFFVRDHPSMAAFARRFLVISDRLKLSEEQIKKLRDLAEDEPKFFELIQRELGLADTAPKIGAGRGQTPAVAVADQFREALEEQCWNVLDDKQQSMAKQIYGRRK